MRCNLTRYINSEIEEGEAPGKAEPDPTFIFRVRLFSLPREEYQLPKGYAANEEDDVRRRRRKPNLSPLPLQSLPPRRPLRPSPPQSPTKNSEVPELIGARIGPSSFILVDYCDFEVLGGGDDGKMTNSGPDSVKVGADFAEGFRGSAGLVAGGAARRMSPGRQTVKGLVEEAKKRVVFLFICVVGLSYLMSCKKHFMLVEFGFRFL